jgi:hypothetical protein
MLAQFLNLLQRAGSLLCLIQATLDPRFILLSLSSGPSNQSAEPIVAWVRLHDAVIFEKYPDP